MNPEQTASTPIVLEGLDLAALLCSRVCHDLISPVGAVVNGLEVLEEASSDESTKVFALDLIKRSASQASARLQFCRLAFGAAGSAGAEIDLGDAENVARGFIEDDKTKLGWQLTRIYMAKNKVKLLLNLLVIASTIIPRGGAISVDPIGEAAAGGFTVSISGNYVRVPQSLAALLSGQTAGPIDAHGIQPFYAGLLARTCGLSVAIEQQDAQVVIKAA
jgi:histidine phosphotransferase ChpT